MLSPLSFSPSAIDNDALPEQIKTFLSENNWAYAVDAKKDVICFAIEYGYRTYPMELVVDTKAHDVAGYFIYPTPCPPSHREEMATLMSAVNEEFLHGGLEMDNDGIVRFRNCLQLAGIKYKAGYLERFIMGLTKAAMSIEHVLQAVMNGEPATQAAALIP